jgi:hypothetical protein
MFQLITTICAIVCGALVLLGALIHILPFSRKFKVIAGVALCLNAITIISAAVIIFFNTAPETAYKHHIQELYYENPPVNPCTQNPQIPRCR